MIDAFNATTGDIDVELPLVTYVQPMLGRLPLLMSSITNGMYWFSLQGVCIAVFPLLWLLVAIAASEIDSITGIPAEVLEKRCNTACESVTTEMSMPASRGERLGLRPPQTAYPGFWPSILRLLVLQPTAALGRRAVTDWPTAHSPWLVKPKCYAPAAAQSAPRTVTRCQWPD